MLVGDEVGAELASRHANRQRSVIASVETEDDVVPTVRNEHEGTIGEVGVLLGEEPTNEVFGDVDLGGRHVLRRHQIDLTRSVGFELWEV